MAKAIVSNTPQTAVNLVDHGTGARPWKPYALPVSGGLHSFAANPPTFAGGFLLDPAGDSVATAGMAYADTAAMCVGESGRLFVTGQDSGTSGLSRFAEFEIPAVVAGTDMAARNVGARVQGFRNIDSDFNLGGYATDENTATIGGLYYDRATGRLHVGTYKYYDAGYNGTLNHLIYENGGDLVNSQRTGPALVGASDDNAAYRSCGYWGGQVIELPAKFHAAFGGTHLIQNARRVAISARASIGPNAGVFTAANHSAGITATPLLYPNSTPLAPQDDWSVTPEVAFTYQIWNHISHVAFAFVIPGTDTLCYVGHNLDCRLDSRGNNTIGYKDANSEGVVSGGYDPYWADAYTGYYWLYDLNELAQTITDPAGVPRHGHAPYEQGYIDIPVMEADWRRNVWGGCFNPDTNQMIFAVHRGAEPRYGSGVCSFEVFDLPGIS